MISDAVRSVSLEAVLAARKSVIANLIQLYKYDFSEFAKVGSRYGEVSADGLFAYEGLDSLAGGRALRVHNPRRQPLGGFRLGKPLVGARPAARPCGGRVFRIAQISPAQSGLARPGLLFARLAGRWEVGVAWYNPPALAFWRAVVRLAADGPVEEWPGDGTRWSGTVLSFAAGQ